MGSFGVALFIQDRRNGKVLVGLFVGVSIMFVFFVGEAGIVVVLFFLGGEKAYR